MKIIKEITRFINTCAEDEINGYAAQAAFFLILSFVPTLMLFISLIRYTPVTESDIQGFVNEFVPSYATSFVFGMVHEMYSRGVGLVSLTALTALWTAGKGIHFLTIGLNRVYGVEETRSWIRLRLRATFYTVVAIVTLVLSLTLLVFGNNVQGFLDKSMLPLYNNITNAIFAARSVLMFVIFVFFFGMVYKWLPNRKIELKYLLPGSFLCALAWTVFSYGLSIYVDRFHGFSMYGSLATIIFVMLWMYFGMCILFICAEINDSYGHHWSRKHEEEKQEARRSKLLDNLLQKFKR